jgi:hypothetical protein
MITKKLFKKISSQDGFAFPATVIIFMVLFILSAAILTSVVAETNFSVRDKKRIQAFYLARSGVEATAEWLVNPANNAAAIIGKTSNPTNLATGIDGQFTVEIIGSLDDPEFIVQSTGTVDGVSAKAAMLIITKSENITPVFPHTIYGETSITLIGTTVIYGDVAQGTGNSINSGGNATLNGEDQSPLKIDLPPIAFPTSGVYETNYTLSNNSTRTMSFDVTNRTRFYDNLSFGNGATLIIDTSGVGNVNLVVNNFTGGNQQSKLVITGSNRLNLFITNSISLSPNINVTEAGDASDPFKLIMYVKPGVGLQFNGNIKFNGFIYAPGVTLNSTGTPAFRGAIIGNITSIRGSFNVNPDGTPYIYDTTLIDFGDMSVIQLTKGSWIKPLN